MTDGLFRGRPVDEWPLNEILREALTAEEIAYLVARSPYSFWEKPLNAKAVLDWAASDLSIPQSRMGSLDGGMETLTLRLAEQLEDDGVRVQLQHRLEAIELPSSSRLSIKLHFQSPTGAQTILARRVILALPRRNIEAIRPVSSLPGLRLVLDAVEPWPITTTALIYRENWWSMLRFTGGRTATDLPARMMRYHSSGSPDRTRDQPGAITFYADGLNAYYWGSLVEPVWLASDHPVTRVMHAQVSLVHQQGLGRQPPEPLCAYVQSWANDPYGGAFQLGRSAAVPIARKPQPSNQSMGFRCISVAKLGRTTKAG